jgi:predicted membrane-bound dolichyl-phosphate-mannose-protein mannosyltransferase
MAKFIFSNGALGFWENFRPFLLPFVLGFGWFLGFPIVLFGKFFQLICSMTIIYLTYYLGERMYKNAGIIAATIVAFLPVFFTFGNLSLTNIPATALTLIALYFLYHKNIIGVDFLLRWLYLQDFYSR